MKLCDIFIIFVITTIVFTSCEKQQNCNLMYKLKASTFSVGIDSETCLLLSSLQNISTITPPITVAAIRSQLETGQIQPFSDAGFDQFLSRLYALDLDSTALTAGEITVLNVIREYLQPAPNYSCCSGSDLPTLPSDFVFSWTPRVGSVTDEYAVDLSFNKLFSCAIYDVKVTSSLVGPNPNVFEMNSVGCVEGGQSFKRLWVDFPLGSPTGAYGFSLEFRDSTGVVLSTVPVTVNF